MRRVNEWLIRQLDRLPDSSPGPLTPKAEQMRRTVEGSISRTVTVTILTMSLAVIAGRVLMTFPYGVLGFGLLMLFSVIVVRAATAYYSRAAVRSYTEWASQQKPRVTRWGVPYERQPPVATGQCSDCTAYPGQRHARSCPSVPPEWFNRGR